MDHLGVGDSDIPEGGPADLSLVARCNHAALQAVLARLKAGELDGGIAPISPSVVMGEGQSMGGQIALLMQAAHDSFDGLALLGCSAVCTRLPARIADGEVCLRGEADHASELAKLKDFDWRWAFHWDDVPEQFAGAKEAASLGRAPPCPIGAARRRSMLSTSSFPAPCRGRPPR
ncbi:hypothetical protein EDF56_10364 [Novosphingobium sp. PhB165]|uniref:hypothetical protein n=1 Tax=Novosphingobium sp. PhB165 TaxID=2485105 RepID=UPI00104F1B44|nr:hypothetical protein [Novosphingobium sp. PhB165]TCM19429.1 hypothetical protein EDF56_10364 [Novosphingobium sp. PhB165]